MQTLKRTFLGRRQDERTLGSKCKWKHPPSPRRQKKELKQRETQGSPLIETSWLSRSINHFAPGDSSNYKFYEETLWSGTMSWQTIEPTPRILTFFAREVIIWMGKTIAKFSLHLTRMTHCGCSTRKCFVPDTVPRNSGAFQSNRWKPASQEPRQSVCIACLWIQIACVQEDKKEMGLPKERIIPKSPGIS